MFVNTKTIKKPLKTQNMFDKNIFLQQQKTPTTICFKTK